MTEREFPPPTPENYEIRRKLDCLAQTDRLQEEFSRPDALIRKAQQEIENDNFDAAWQTLEEIKGITQRAGAEAERLRILLRQIAAEKKK